MTITKKDNLYNLIKSLSKNEKKYFHDFLKKQNESKLYLLLFNKIDKQSKHQKNEIKIAFDTKANQLPVIKNYLIKTIQKVLNIYHRESSNFDIIQNNLLEINQLVQRELYDLAYFEIEKTIDLAHHSELPHQLLQTLEFKKQLLIKKHGATSEEIKKDLVAIIEEQNKILAKIYNLHEFQQLQATFYEHFHQSSGLTPVIYTNLNKNPLIIDEKTAESTAARLIQADLNYRLHIFKDKNFPAADAAIQKAIRLLENNSELIHQEPESYLNLLNQRLQLLFQQKKIPEIQETLGKIRHAPDIYNFNAKKPFLRRYIMEAYAIELSLYRQAGEIAKADHLIEKIHQEYKDLNSPALRQWRTVMDYEIAKYYFDQERYNDALKKTKEISYAEYSVREAEILLRSLFLRAQIALIQKNYLDLKRTLSQLKKFFKTIKKATRLENHLTKFLEQYPTMIYKVRQHQKLQTQFNKIKQSAEKKVSPEQEDLIVWLENHFLLESKEHN